MDLMQTALRRSLLTPLHYWRTFTTVSIVGLIATMITADPVAKLLVTTASAFAFSSYENRRWISMPTDTLVGDSVCRVLIALTTVCVLAMTR